MIKILFYQLRKNNKFCLGFYFNRVKDYANRVKSSGPLRATNLKAKSKYIPRRVSVVT